MQTFESFLRVYVFCLQMHMDSSYVSAIDRELESGHASKETKLLIQQVRSFHAMRSSMCNCIKDHLNNPPLLNDLYKARGLEQLNTVPENAKCAICGETLQSSQGVLLLVNGMRPFTVHKRYKVMLYNFWILVHFPEEIVKGSEEWLNSRHWTIHRKLKTVSDRVAYISEYNDKMFPKKLYIKLKNIGQYIQREFPTMPINHATQ